jgi:hypothetical protein
MTMADTFNIGLGSKAPATSKVGSDKVTDQQRLAEIDNKQKDLLGLAQNINNLFEGTNGEIDSKTKKTLQQYNNKEMKLEMELRRRETDYNCSENPQDFPKDYKPVFGFDTKTVELADPSRQSVFNIGESKSKDDYEDYPFRGHVITVPDPTEQDNN